MRWGFAAGQICLEDDPQPLLEQAAQHFDHWEITGEGPLARRVQVGRAADVARDLGLELSYHTSFRDMDIAVADPDVRTAAVERLVRQILWAGDIGAGSVVVHPGRRLAPGALVRSRASLVRLASAGRLAGVEVRVENMARGHDRLADDPAELADLVSGTTGAACLDLGHLRTLEGSVNVAPLEPLVRQLHVHANDGSADQHRVVPPQDPWLAGKLRRFDAPDRLAVFEHRHVGECVRSLRNARAMVDGAD